MFSAVNVLFIKCSGRIADSNATLSKSVALDIATYGRPLANGFVFYGSYTIPLWTVILWDLLVVILLAEVADAYNLNEVGFRKLCVINWRW